MAEDTENRGQRTEDGGQADDAELVRRYADEKSEEAFAELVRRHLTPVYAFALKRVGGDAHLAEDVAQIVFTTLARKAASLADRPVLGGWLCRTTHFAARDIVRAESRRRAREQEALTLTMHESSTADSSANIDWEKLQPMLARTMGELNDDEDRDAVWLRFFEGRSFAEVGAKLRLTENAARMRVERALDKLHAALARRGITSTLAALGVALANQAAAVAPATLAASVTGAALAGAAASGSAGAWLAFLTMSKIKAGIVSAIVVGVIATGVVELRANRELRAELGASRSTDDEVARLQRESLQLSASMARLGATNPEVAELTRLRAHLAALKTRPDGVIESEIRAPQNRGRATPKAAMETFCWGIVRDDIDLVASFINFSDDSPENRAAFMANFSPAVRARYGTPERLGAAAFFSVGHPNPDPQVAVQILSVDEDHGPNQVKIKIWGRNASGVEWAGGDTYVKKGDGWTSKPVSLTKDSIIKFAVSRLDPATGDVLPLK